MLHDRPADRTTCTLAIIVDYYTCCLLTFPAFHFIERTGGEPRASGDVSAVLMRFWSVSISGAGDSKILDF